MSKVLCDTDVLIELYKGNETVIQEMERTGDTAICISDVTAGELLFCARNKRDHQILKKDIERINRLPIDSNGNWLLFWPSCRRSLFSLIVLKIA